MFTKNDDVAFEPKANYKIFKEFFANRSTNLVNGLRTPTTKFGIDRVKTYYSNLNLNDNNFNLKPTSYEIVLKLLDKIGG